MTKKIKGVKKMTQPIKGIFVNLPVKDLERSRDFFTQLDFNFDPLFTDETGSCMIIGENIYVMLLIEDYFKGFTHQAIADTSSQNEVIVTLLATTKAQVIELCEKAAAAGAEDQPVENTEKFMYYRRFKDLDGHLWEIMCFNMKEMK